MSCEKQLFHCHPLQLSNEQCIVSEMEATLHKKMEEHEELESQIQTEHEEEVKALYQQKQQLVRQLEDAKMSYYRNFSEQDQRVRLSVTQMNWV